METLFNKRMRAILTIHDYIPKLSQDRLRGTCLIVLASGCATLVVDDFFFDLLRTPPIFGGLFIVAGIYLELVMIRLFANSAYYNGLASKTGQGNYRQTTITYDVATVVHGNPEDLTAAFLKSTFGTHIYVRAELRPEAVDAWLRSPRHQVPVSALSLRTNQATTLMDVVDCILALDTDFLEFIQHEGIPEDAVRGAAAMVFDTYYAHKRAERWWSRDALSRRGSLGRTLTLGAWRDYVPYTTAIPPLETETDAESTQYIVQMSEVLQSKRDSNLIIIAPDEATSLALVARLQHALTSGTALGGVNNMSLITIDHEAILATHPSTIAIEAILREILAAAERAGNMSIVVPNLLETNTRYLTRGVQFMHIIEEFMTAAQVHVILITTPPEYGLIRNQALTLIKRCHELIIEPLTRERMILLLSPLVAHYEEMFGTMVSYPAVAAIAEVSLTYDAPTLQSGERFLLTVMEQYATMPLITRSEALAHLGSTLGLPLGPIGEEERDMLLSLEPRMQQTIVGQERALRAIGSALRRRRTNLTDISEPFASFLFLGPSGVGKTETAKTIARVYFGGEHTMVRIDMSEFAEVGSLSRLIGDGSGIGVLERYLANHPKGLVLLDEFEKAHPDVTEIFLQILDEGKVTTSSGSILSFRQHMIIATSNAGSDLIARTSESRALTPVLDSDIIAHIIQKQILPAELIGRFSEVILFDSLTPENEVTIAEQVLNQLIEKVREQGFLLKFEQGVSQAVVSQSHDTHFGARPLRHAIEHTIEDIIATRIIRGEVKPGDTITIHTSDVTTSVSH